MIIKIGIIGAIVSGKYTFPTNIRTIPIIEMTKLYPNNLSFKRFKILRYKTAEKINLINSTPITCQEKITSLMEV